METIKTMGPALPPWDRSEYVIETNALTKRFPKTLAADRVDLHVRRGDIYGLIGKNGAGKTTVMKMILGILTPTAGSISLFGSDALAAGRKRIGSLIEAPGIYKNCTALENLKRFALLSGDKTTDLVGLLKFVGLGTAANRRAGAFSLGMKQRLGIAIALIGDPEVLILDEPINGLDPAGIKEIRELILKLNREKGITMMISSHLLDELGKVATVYGIINGGELVEEVSAAELADRSREGLRIRTSDPKRAVALLRENGVAEITVKEDAIVTHVGAERAAEINALLVKAGIDVSELTNFGGGFEDYFIQRLGK